VKIFKNAPCNIFFVCLQDLIKAITMLCSEENDPSFVLIPLFIKPLLSTTCLSLDVTLDGTTIAARHFLQRANRAYKNLPPVICTFCCACLYGMMLESMLLFGTWVVFSSTCSPGMRLPPKLFENSKSVQKLLEVCLYEVRKLPSGALTNLSSSSLIPQPAEVVRKN